MESHIFLILHDILFCNALLFFVKEPYYVPFAARLLAQLLAGHEEDLERRGLDLSAKLGLNVALDSRGKQHL